MLDRYLYLSGTTNSRFASLAGVSSQTIYLWRHGTVTPSRGKLLSAIALRNAELVEALHMTEELGASWQKESCGVQDSPLPPCAIT